MLKVAAPVTLKNILVATDFSPLWDIALPFVSALAGRYQANLTLLNVIPAVIYPEIPLDPYPPGEEKQREAMMEKLGSIADGIPVPDSNKSRVVRIGDTVQAVLDVVADRHIDLVVVTTHGRSGFSRLVLGSTAEQILRRVPCPVLTIGPKTNKALEFEKFKTILIPVDFSAESNDAAMYAVALGKEQRAKIVVLHIIDRTFPPYQIESSKIFADHEILNIDTDGLETERIVRVGAVEEEIVEAAVELGASCMVMGRHKHGALSTHFPFTTLHTVLSNAPCPVFTVA
jgi:nucleotide-binding universal stress UspA family protein